MSVFVDTSAFYAILDGADPNNTAAGEQYRTLVQSGTRMVSHNYVLVETTALVQNRLGVEAVRAFHTDVCQLLDIHWIDSDLHDVAVTALLAAAHRDVSLVDWTSFEFMRRNQLRRAFAFDADFATQGLELLP